jgi:alkylation response protein AidB-like acyl-CoA dehydrogenase
MLLDLTSDQEFLRDTTARYLANTVPVAALRRLRHDPVGYDDEYWQGGADLGWTSLLVDEDHGGGSVSASGLVDLTLIAHEFGNHAAPGPFLPCNLVAAALNQDASGGHGEVLKGLLSGASVAAWCLAEPHPTGHLPEELRFGIRVARDELVLTGVKRPVEAAERATHLLVTGRTDDGLTQVLVPTETPGVTVQPLQSVDLTRRFSLIRFDDVRVPAGAAVGEVGGAGAQIGRQWELAQIIMNAESIGAMQAAFDMTVEWAFDRYSFGRPLASYQELKHRFADMKSWLEAAHAVSDGAAAAVDAQAPGADELVSVAKAFIGEYGVELLHDCVQMHGGIGITFDHDLHLFLRRATANRALLGTPADHRQRIATLLEQRELAS